MNKRTVKMAETRIKLIAAARKAFAEQGYSGATMDQFTADVGLTRGALYHNFGDKRGLFAAVVEQIDSEMAEFAKQVGESVGGSLQGLLAEGIAYIEKSLDPEVKRIVLMDGPAVLGDPSQWPSQSRCLDASRETIKQLINEGILKNVDPEAAAVLMNGAALNAALWVASSSSPSESLPKAITAFKQLASGFIK